MIATEEGVQEGEFSFADMIASDARLHASEKAADINTSQEDTVTGNCEGVSSTGTPSDDSGSDIQHMQERK